MTQIAEHHGDRARAGRPAPPGPLRSYVIALIEGTGPCECMTSTAEPPLSHSLDATVLNSA